MALGSCASANHTAALAAMTPRYPRSGWQQINDDLETADTASLLKPWNITRAAFHWCLVPDWATRVLVRAKIDAVATTFTTAPVLRLVGVFPKDFTENTRGLIRSSGFSGTSTDANSAEFLRLDTKSANTTGFTLSITSASTTMYIDTTGYIYTDPVDLAGYDLLNASFIGLMVETAAAVTGGALNTVAGEVLFAS